MACFAPPLNSANIDFSLKIVVKNEQIKSQAMVYRLASRNKEGLAALYNLTYAGQTFDGSTDGNLVGTKRPESLMPILTGDGSSFTVQINDAEALIVEIGL